MTGGGWEVGCACEPCVSRRAAEARAKRRQEARQRREAARALPWQAWVFLVAWTAGLVWLAPSCTSKAEAGWDGLTAVVEELRGLRRAVERIGDKCR